MTNYLLLAVYAILAYLAGAIPSGYLVAKSRGVDIRQVGSGNIGGTNVTRSLGFKWGAVVGVLDFFKSYIPSVLALHYLKVDWQVVLISIMPVIGHVYPVWLKFKGGKGVSTVFGILMANFGFVFFLIWFVVWYLAVKAVKLMSLVNLVMALIFPFLFWFKYHSWLFVAFGVLLTILVWWSHRSNIKRLLAGNENLTNY
jgi:acyl phosphate:glycerol-3-phosphate acyltransferase